MSGNIPFAIAAAIGLTLIHLFAGRLRFLEGIPRNRWLSAAGGVSIAYVFIHIFPELKKGQEEFQESLPQLFLFFEHHVYLIALLGFIAFYSLERFVKTYGSDKKSAIGTPSHQKGIFWIHIASFTLYNALIGYLLIQEERNVTDLLLFFLAIGLHFIINDFGLREHHKVTYDKIGKWILGTAVLAGSSIGLIVNLPEKAVTALFAFLAGGIILNVTKEELPEDRKSSATAFFLGAVFYATLLLAL